MPKELDPLKEKVLNDDSLYEPAPRDHIIAPNDRMRRTGGGGWNTENGQWEGPQNWFFPLMSDVGRKVGYFNDGSFQVQRRKPFGHYDLLASFHESLVVHAVPAPVPSFVRVKERALHSGEGYEENAHGFH